MLYVHKYQAINNLAAVSSNAKKIVEGGGLQHYIKLSGPEYDKSIQTEAARGLYLLASKCRDSVINERGCLDGRYCFVMFVLLFLSSYKRTKCTYTAASAVMSSVVTLCRPPTISSLKITDRSFRYGTGPDLSCFLIYF